MGYQSSLIQVGKKEKKSFLVTIPSFEGWTIFICTELIRDPIDLFAWIIPLQRCQL